MTPDQKDIRELLPLYALGILEAPDAAAVEAAVASDSALAAELASYQASAELLVAPATPPPDVKARLMASTGGGRFEKLSNRMATLFDVAVDKAREFLGLIERPASWEQEQGGISLVHFAGGPAYAAADCGFVRLEPGAIFPPHKHLGEEAMLVLQGQLRDGASNRLLGPGDLVLQAEGSEHHLICEGSEPCIFAARAMNGIAVAGAPVRPSKPTI
jgi:quercetin dioxygenase-like cupin family protein